MIAAALMPMLAMLLVGLAGSVHCVGMCGGIVSAFSMLPPRPFPVPVVARAGRALTRVAAYNAGRICSYTCAGALAGTIGGRAGGAGQLARLAGIAMPGLWLASAMLIALGLYLSGAWRGLAVLERFGGHLWRHLEPLTAQLLPLDRPHKLFAMGAIWGWLPCGMVYSSLLAALVCGSAWQGASLMLAFGLGTLPLLMVAGIAGARLRAVLQRPAARAACGVMVAGFGVTGMLRAAGGVTALLPGFCLGPA